ncbi:hypothetical protein [Magnetofaba australis]|uniref:Uncharacterized protein n=1 Tax=Magnetofaba australis IT-1 TaxID=1434232 RepID=A0A1Y2JZT6_9PROT|nr:hypothetical protein [Magnetofaba australis]OSM00054.1 hypothetical protein MAIT1_00469 [Magnetofaba australis IT-1]
MWKHPPGLSWSDIQEDPERRAEAEQIYVDVRGPVLAEKITHPGAQRMTRGNLNARYEFQSENMVDPDAWNQVAAQLTQRASADGTVSMGFEGQEASPRGWAQRDDDGISLRHTDEPMAPVAPWDATPVGGFEKPPVNVARPASPPVLPPSVSTDAPGPMGGAPTPQPPGVTSAPIKPPPLPFQHSPATPPAAPGPLAQPGINPGAPSPAGGHPHSPQGGNAFGAQPLSPPQQQSEENPYAGVGPIFRGAGPLSGGPDPVIEDPFRPIKEVPFVNPPAPIGPPTAQGSAQVIKPPVNPDPPPVQQRNTWSDTAPMKAAQAVNKEFSSRATGSVSVPGERWKGGVPGYALSSSAPRWMNIDVQKELQQGRHPQKDRDRDGRKQQGNGGGGMEECNPTWDYQCQNHGRRFKQ